MSDYNAREIAILRAFWNKERTVQQVADELDISYEVCVKEVRNLIRSGAIQELPFRRGRQRFLTSVEIPGSVSLPPVDKIVMPWGNKLQTIPGVLLTIAPTPDKSIRFRVMQLLMTLEHIGEQRAEGNEAGWSSKDVRMAMRRVLSEVNTWRDYIEQLLKLPIWYDDTKAINKIGTGTPDEMRHTQALEAERHFMSSGKRALEE